MSSFITCSGKRCDTNHVLVEAPIRILIHVPSNAPSRTLTRSYSHGDYPFVFVFAPTLHST